MDESTAKTVRIASMVLAVATGFCVVGIFTITAHGNYGYGRDVMQLGGLSWAVVVGLDVLQIVAITGAFVVAQAPLRVRAYAWLVFGIANAGSILSNISDAAARHLPVEGMWGAAVLPVMLSLGVHLAIVTWRWRPAAEPVPTTTTGRVAAEDVPPDPAPAEVDTHVGEYGSRPPGSDAPEGIVVQVPQPSGHREGARARFAAGETDCAKLARQAGVSKRTVQLWVRDLRPAATNGAKR